MHPVLLQIGDFTLGTYGVMIVLGAVAALWLAGRLARRRGLPVDFFYDLAFVFMLSGFLGARLLYIGLNFGAFVEDPMPFIVSRTGFVFLGGFITAAAAGVWFTRRRGIALLEAGDIVAPCLALAHGFGRIGCFLAGCCYGVACGPGHDHGPLDALAVQYPLVTDAEGEPSLMFNMAYWDQLDAGLIEPASAAPLPVLPVQLMESLANFLIAAGLVWLWGRRRFSGQALAAYLVSYSAIRFLLEFLRGDLERGIFLGGALSTSQIISLFTLGAGLVLWRLRRGRGLESIPQATQDTEKQ